MNEQNKRTVLKFIEAMSNGDSVAAAECLAPDAVAVTKGFSSFTGTSQRDTVIKMIGSMKDLLPTGLRTTVHRVIANGDDVAVEFEGDAVTRNGVPYCNQYCMVFTLSGGQIIRTHEYFCTKLAESALWPVISGTGIVTEAGNA